MTTAGGLVLNGTPGGKFIALDDETGEVLWSFQTGLGIVGQPITWEQDGTQHVTALSGWGGEVANRVNYLNQGDMMWTFRLSTEFASAG